MRLRTDCPVYSIRCRQIRHTVRNEIDVVVFVNRLFRSQPGSVEVVTTEITLIKEGTD